MDSFNLLNKEEDLMTLSSMENLVEETPVQLEAKLMEANTLAKLSPLQRMTLGIDENLINQEAQFTDYKELVTVPPTLTKELSRGMSRSEKKQYKKARKQAIKQNKAIQKSNDIAEQKNKDSKLKSVEDAKNRSQFDSRVKLLLKDSRVANLHENDEDISIYAKDEYIKTYTEGEIAKYIERITLEPTKYINTSGGPGNGLNGALLVKMNELQQELEQMRKTKANYDNIVGPALTKIVEDESIPLEERISYSEQLKKLDQVNDQMRERSNLVTTILLDLVESIKRHKDFKADKELKGEKVRTLEKMPSVEEVFQNAENKVKYNVIKERVSNREAKCLMKYKAEHNIVSFSDQLPEGFSNPALQPLLSGATREFFPEQYNQLSGILQKLKVPAADDAAYNTLKEDINALFEQASSIFKTKSALDFRTEEYDKIAETKTDAIKPWIEMELEGKRQDLPERVEGYNKALNKFMEKYNL